MLIDRVVKGYIEAAIWADLIPADTSGNWESGSDTYDYTDVEPESDAHVTASVKDWVEAHEADFYAYLDAGLSAGRFGHDLRLTSGGHGTGFWDRDLGALGDRLTLACKRWPLDMECCETEEGTVVFDREYKWGAV